MYFKIYLVYVPEHIQNFWDYQKPYDEENKQRDYTIFENCFYESNLDNDISSRELRISLNNNLEIKIKDPSQSDKLLKIAVIKQLTFKIDYDLDKKEFKWSNIYFNINISFTKNVTTQFRGSITPYKILKSPINPYKEIVIDKIGFFTIKNFNLYISYSMNNKISQEAVKKQ